MPSLFSILINISAIVYLQDRDGQDILLYTIDCSIGADPNTVLVFSAPHRENVTLLRKFRQSGQNTLLLLRRLFLNKFSGRTLQNDFVFHNVIPSSFAKFSRGIGSPFSGSLS